MKYYFERMIGTIMALVVPVSIFIFIFGVLSIIAGHDYLDGQTILILQITIIANLIRPLGYHMVLPSMPSVSR